jgi:hypothetical protein
MPKNFKHLTVAEWKEQYYPINESELETHGAFRELLKTQDPYRIWTVCNDGERDVIESGWHFVNADGVYITVFPCEEDTLIYVYDEGEAGDGNESDNEDG